MELREREPHEKASEKSVSLCCSLSRDRDSVLTHPARPLFCFGVFRVFRGLN